jgi:hypothetical protein
MGMFRWAALDVLSPSEITSMTIDLSMRATRERSGSMTRPMRSTGSCQAAGGSSQTGRRSRRKALCVVGFSTTGLPSERDGVNPSLDTRRS